MCRAVVLGGAMLYFSAVINRRILAASALACVFAAVAPAQSTAARPPNDNGRVPILMYHLVGDKDSRWGRSVEHFRADLEMLYKRGYRPITVAQLIDKQIDIPVGTSPVVFTFDDASPGQFRYLEKNGQLEVDPTSAVGIWLDFNKAHPDWGKRATFCLLPGASAGHAFFGDKGIEGQKSAWRLQKVKFLADQGFELCNHTLWHANLSKYSDAVVQEQIARGVLAIDSAVAGYKVRTFALPLGIWPKNRALAAAGSWHDPKSGRDVKYAFDAILEVSGPSAPSPSSPNFKPRSLPRIQVVGNELEKELDRLEKNGQRYVSGGPSKRAGSTPKP
jgi:peptidoglycan/xylan/chitin deacetylase (PgdA/CDA1 family)